ncbi:MAG: antitoxin [Acidimicrobiales bacterium]
MGIMDKVKGLFSQHGEQVDAGIEKAGDVIDDKTGGKAAEEVDKGQDAARQGLDKLTGDDDAQ